MSFGGERWIISVDDMKYIIEVHVCFHMEEDTPSIDELIDQTSTLVAQTDSTPQPLPQMDPFSLTTYSCVEYHADYELNSEQVRTESDSH